MSKETALMWLAVALAIALLMADQVSAQTPSPSAAANNQTNNPTNNGTIINNNNATAAANRTNNETATASRSILVLQYGRNESASVNESRTILQGVNASTTLARNRERSATLTIPRTTAPTPVPTNATPAPTVSGDEIADRDYDFYAVAIFRVPFVEFERNLDFFTTRYILPAMPDRSLQGRVRPIDYCPMRAADGVEANLKTWACPTIPRNENPPLTWVSFAFFNSEGRYNLSSLRLADMPLATVVTSSGATTYLFAIEANTAPRPSPAPGIVSRAADNASSPAGVVLILIMIALLICVCILVGRRCCAKDAAKPQGASAFDGVNPPDAVGNGSVIGTSAAAAMSRAAARSAAYSGGGSVDYDSSTTATTGPAAIPPVASAAPRIEPSARIPPPSSSSSSGVGAGINFPPVPRPGTSAADAYEMKQMPPTRTSTPPPPLQPVASPAASTDLFANFGRPVPAAASTAARPVYGGAASPTTPSGGVEIPIDDDEYGGGSRMPHVGY